MTEARDGILITGEDISSVDLEKLKLALSLIDLRGIEAQIIQLPEEPEPLNETRVESLGYASYEDLKTFGISREKYKRGIHTRLWNSLVRIGGNHKYDGGTVVWVSDTLDGWEVFKVEEMADPSPFIGYGRKNTGKGYHLNLDALEQIVSNGRLRQIPEVGVTTYQFAVEYLLAHRTELDQQSAHESTES